MKEKRVKGTLSPSTERRPLRMHSLRPVPRTMTSYSSSIICSLYFNLVMANEVWMNEWIKNWNKNEKWKYRKEGGELKERECVALSGVLNLNGSLAEFLRTTSLFLNWISTSTFSFLLISGATSTLYSSFTIYVL